VFKLQATPPTPSARRLAAEGELRRLEEHLLRVAELGGFSDQSGHLLARVRRLFHRMELEPEEVNILRGVLATAEAQWGKPHGGPSS